MDIAGRAVFFAELDDDYQEITNLSQADLLSRLTCYYLIAPRIILHPAYVWQSEESYRLVTKAGHELLRPPFTELELGAYDSIEAYMRQRLEQLERPNVVTRELRSYWSYGDDLYTQARNLSVRFSDAPRRKVPSNQRDRKFRRLIHEDLDTARVDRQTLGQILQTLTVGARGRLSETPLGEKLKYFVATGADLVSVDTFLKELGDRGFPETVESVELRRQLLSLYYETYCDPDIMIPGTRKLLVGSTVNPYDADVFWAAMGALFGKEFVQLSRTDNAAALLALRDIKETGDWQAFTSVYFDSFMALDLAVMKQPDSVVESLRTLHPGGSRSFVLRQLWESKKMVLAGAVLGALGIPGFTLETLAGAGITAAGAAGVTASTAAVVGEAKRFVERYKSQDIVKTQETIQFYVDRAISTMRLERRAT